MKIIILGAGQVGSTLAEHLVQEDNDITIVDSDRNQLKALQTRLDIRTIVGPASHPDILKAAGAADADMLIAVTSEDETNMVACQVAYTIFKTPIKIARMRSADYLAHDELYDNKALPIDYWICPEQLVTHSIKRIIDIPGALQVLDFADNKVQLVAVRPKAGGRLLNKTISELNRELPGIEMQITAIFRGREPLYITSETKIEANDEVFFIAATPHVEAIMQGFGRMDEPYKRIIITGGGNIGIHLAAALESNFQVKLIDHNVERTKILAEKLRNTTILLGEAADEELLLSENIEEADVFISVTNDDEANIMSALLAKNLGVKKVVALITRSAYADLIEGGDIDVAFSPQQITIGSILTHIRRGDIVNVYSLRRGAAEAIEVVIHGDERTSNTIGRKISELKLPKEAHIGAIVREDNVLIAKKDLVFKSNDHVIIFLENIKHIHEIERLFEVDISYF